MYGLDYNAIFNYSSLTKDKADRFIDGCLVRKLRLQELGGEEVSELTGLIPTHVLVVHIDLSQPPHHGQLEILVIHGLVRSAGEGEAVGDLQPSVSYEAEEGALGDPAAAGASLQLMAVLDQLHDHQTVNLDNLKKTYEQSSVQHYFLLSSPQYWTHFQYSYENFHGIRPS